MALTKNQLTMRRTGISASDVAAILGLNPYRKPIDVWADKTSIEPPEEKPETEQQALGHVFERFIASHYAKNLAPEGMKRRLSEPKKTLVHPDLDWVFATPDRFVFEGPDLSHLPRGLKHLAECMGASHLAEIKLVGPYAIKNWIADVEEGQEDEVESSDRVPFYVFCQCQWQMLVTGYRRVDVVALLAGTKLRVFPIMYDEDFTNDALAICRDFRERYILPGIEPPPDGSSSYRSYLDSKYPGSTQAALVEAPEHVGKLVMEYQHINAALKELSDKKEQIQQSIKTVIGHNDGLQADWGKVTWRLTRGRVDYKKLVKAYNVTDQQLDKFRTPGRTFRVTVRKDKKG